MRQQFEVLEKGIATPSLDVKALASGTYLILVDAGGIVYQAKLVVTN